MEDENSGISRGASEECRPLSCDFRGWGFASWVEVCARRAFVTRWMVAWLCLILPRGVPGQEARFELGQRLRVFEIAWEGQPDARARARSVPHLNNAVRAFFTLRWEQAAHSIDRARFAVQAEADPSASVAWATALSLRPATRLVDRAAGGLEITLAPFYKVQAGVPEKAAVDLALCDGEGKTVAAAEGDVLNLPWRGNLRWDGIAEGDYRLMAEVVVDQDRVALCPQTISIVANPAGRLKQIESALRQFEAQPKTTQRATLAAQASILRSLLAKETLETNYPAARLLDELEAAIAVVSSGGEYYGKGRPGEFWITLANEHGSVPARLMAPPSAARGKPLPLVIAFHGAGGSENMFFDAYGNGKIVELCRRRGWLLVAAKLSFWGLGMPPDRVLAEIAQLYPVDKRQVFLVGHSMGAMQAISVAQRLSEPVAAVAAISGGGRVGKTGPWTSTAFQVIAGDRDFALPAARRLAQDLRAAGVDVVRFLECRDAEHLLVVQAALDDVFAFFDEIATKRSKTRPAVPTER
jgi:pimeloyl-ACP methyl ester carboxylesterase